MSFPKRVRNPNWDNEEKAMLIDILQESVSILNDKKTDTNTNKRKKTEWERVLNRFNELNKIKRDLPQIQSQWKQLKMGTKFACSNYKRSLTQTGGGPPPISPKPDDIKIMEMVPLEFEVDSNEFDSDGLISINISPRSQVSDVPLIVVIECEDGNEDLVMQEQSMSEVHEPNEGIQLRETPIKISSSKRRKGILSSAPKRKLIKRNISHAAEEYSSSIVTMTEEAQTFRNNLLLKEHDMKINHMEKKMKMIEEQHDLHIKMIKEQHALQKKILQKCYNKTEH